MKKKDNIKGIAIVILIIIAYTILIYTVETI